MDITTVLLGNAITVDIVPTEYPTGIEYRYDIYDNGMIIGAFKLGEYEDSPNKLRNVVKIMEEKGVLFNGR